MHMMSRQDRSAAAAHETIGLLRRVRTLAVQQTPASDYRTPIPRAWQLRCSGRQLHADFPVRCIPGYEH
jgi:hypothetical protein